MKNLIISLESTCDLTKELVNEYNLKIIDMDFMIDDVIYSTKNNDVVSSDLYEKMRKGSKTQTSQINETLYEEFFNELVKENQPILHIAFSSGLSNTYISAKVAAEKINKKLGKQLIFVIDSLCACSGHGMLAILARQFSEKTENLQDVIDYVEIVKNRLNHCFSVDALKYLANGGRINKSAAFLGTILNIKPVMRMDEQGKLTVVKKVISRKKALLEIYKTFIETYSRDSKFCFISHADCIKDAEFLAEKIKSGTDLNVYITNLGPIIGAHSGPGTIALYFLASNR